MFRKIRNKKGFTLVELLVVVAIIGILAVVAVPNLFKSIDKAKISELESDYMAIKSAVLSYYAENTKLRYTSLENAYELHEYIDGDIRNSSIGGDYYLVPDMVDDNKNPYINFNGYMWNGTSKGNINEDYKYFKSGELQEKFKVVLRIMPKYKDGTIVEIPKITEKQFKKLSSDLGNENVFISNPKFNKPNAEIYIGVINK